MYVPLSSDEVLGACRGAAAGAAAALAAAAAAPGACGGDGGPDSPLSCWASLSSSDAPRESDCHLTCCARRRRRESCSNLSERGGNGETLTINTVK